MNKPSNLLLIVDNGGKTIDRYTILTKDGDLYACSENPFLPTGFGMFVGEISNIQNDNINSIEKYQKQIKEQPDWLGQEVEFEKLNENIQQFIAMSCDPIEEETK